MRVREEWGWGGEGWDFRGARGFFLYFFALLSVVFGHSVNLSFCRVFFLTLGKPPICRVFFV